MQENKDKIFRYLKSNFLRHGYYKTSMDSLAAELKISKKTIYKYYPSKEAIVHAIVKDIVNDLSGKMQKIVQSEENSINKSIKLLDTVTDLLFQVGEKWLEDIRIHNPNLWQEIEDFRTKRLYVTLSSIIDQGKKENLFLDKPIEIVISIFLSSLRGIVNEDFLFHNRFSYHEAVSETLEILFAGILTPKGLKLFNKSFKKVQDEIH